MRVRLPLYTKILGWFFLNLVIVAAAVAALFNAQFHFNLDWLFLSGARERIEAVRDLIIGELEATTPDEWPAVMDRYSAAHRVRFALYDNDARLIVGGIEALPEEVRTHILERPFPFTRRTSPIPSPPPEARGRGGPRFPIRALLRTARPTRYWLLASGRLDNPMIGDAMRVVLVARANTISGGGLILDPKPWLLVGTGVLVFSLLFWWPLVHGITRTLGRMMNATRQMADGRFDVRLNLRRGDELGALAESVDQMASRLDGYVTGQKRFLGDIAHELCSPLARLQMALGILEQRAVGEQADFVRSASEKAEQIAALVGELLSFSKASFGASAVQLHPVNLREAVDEAIHRERTETAEVRADLQDVLVSADRDLLVRAIANLLRNAIRYAASAGPITVTTTSQGREVLLTIADQGPGVPEAELPKIFDAFYRTDPARTRETGGTGLGLAIVKTCIESCGGTVSARNRQPHGLEATVTLHQAEV
jgi:two-component system sensor histidine kinase CpxA